MSTWAYYTHVTCFSCTGAGASSASSLLITFSSSFSVIIDYYHSITNQLLNQLIIATLNFTEDIQRSKMIEGGCAVVSRQVVLGTFGENVTLVTPYLSKFRQNCFSSFAEIFVPNAWCVSVVFDGNDLIDITYLRNY